MDNGTKWIDIRVIHIISTFDNPEKSRSSNVWRSIGECSTPRSNWRNSQPVNRNALCNVSLSLTQTKINQSEVASCFHLVSTVPACSGAKRDTFGVHWRCHWKTLRSECYNDVNTQSTFISRQVLSVLRNSTLSINWTRNTSTKRRDFP